MNIMSVYVIQKLTNLGIILLRLLDIYW